MKLSLVLPIPPSTNHLYKTVWIDGKARRVKSQEAREYTEAVGLVIIAKYGQVRMRPPIRIDGVLYAPNFRTVDLDNLKCLVDAISQAVGVNDNRLVHN